MTIPGKNTRGGHKPMEQNIGKGELYPLTYFNIDILKKTYEGKLVKICQIFPLYPFDVCVKMTRVRFFKGFNMHLISSWR
jgi:hypothetical protein